jgi:hypothetical protein
MQRIARSSPITAEAALIALDDLVRLEELQRTGRRVWSGDEESGRFEVVGMTAEERLRLRACQALVDRLPREGLDKRLSYPLGVLFARGEIQPRHHYVGRRYAAAFVAAIRPLTVPSILADLVGRGAVQFYRPDRSGTARAELEVAYRQAHDELASAGLRALRTVEDVAIYEEGSAVPGTPRFRALIDGLDRLDRHYDTVDRAREYPAAAG